MAPKSIMKQKGKLEKLGVSKEQREKERKQAAEEEAERKRLEAIAAAEEAARQAAIKQAEEEELARAIAQKRPPTTDDKQRDLYEWLGSLPLTRPLGKLERTFSDGLLVAEIIDFYLPEICNKTWFYTWHSSINKISNWELLNYKVFPKLGFKLNDRHIHSILHPYSCGKFQKESQCDGMFIFKLLFKLKKVIAELNPDVNNYKNGGGKQEARPSQPSPFQRKTKFGHAGRPTYSRIEMLLEKQFLEAEKRGEGKLYQPGERSLYEGKGAGAADNGISFVNIGVPACCAGQIMQQQRASFSGYAKRYLKPQDGTTFFLRPTVTTSCSAIPPPLQSETVKFCDDPCPPQPKCICKTLNYDDDDDDECYPREPKLAQVKFVDETNGEC